MTGAGLSEAARYYLAQIRQTFDRNRADLCAHGVRREHCVDHKLADHPSPDTEETA